MNSDVGKKDLYIKYVGVIGLLSRISNKVSDEERESIELAIQDFCEISGWSYKDNLGTFLLIEPGE